MHRRARPAEMCRTLAAGGSRRIFRSARRPEPARCSWLEPVLRLQGRPIKPKHRKSKFWIRRLDKRASDASAAAHSFRSAIDDVAEEPTAVIEPDECDNVRRFVLPLGLNGPANDRKSFNHACAAALFPCDNTVARWTALGWRPAKMIKRSAKRQQQAARACCFPVRGSLATVSWRRIFHVASSSKTPCVANRPPIP
jgi:hypothetical protein